MTQMRDDMTASAPVTTGGLPVKTAVVGTEVVPMPQVSAKPQPAMLVQRNVPTETQSDAIIAARANRDRQPATPQGQRAASAARSPSSVPTLEEMPVMLSDLGLVLLNTGHI